ISGVDPIAAGLVASLNRPGGNLTGVSNYNTSLTAKRLELLHQVVPRADTIAVLVNSTSPAGQTIETEARSAPPALGLRLAVLGASTEGEIDAAFAAAAQRGAGGLLVAGDAYFNRRRAQLIALAARYRIPANYDRKEIAIDGGLMSYGMNNVDLYRQVGIYTGQILRGANPADFPVQQPTKVELVVNRSRHARSRASGCDASAFLCRWARTILKQRPVSRHSGRACNNWDGSTARTYRSVSAMPAPTLCEFAPMRRNWWRSYRMSFWPLAPRS